MDRIDSGFDASFFAKAIDTETERGPVYRKNTAPTHHWEPRKTTSDSLNPQATDMSKSRPASEKRPSAQRRSTTEARRSSISSSSENLTTRSRTRGHVSKPSSRRKSCTLVDPSRPARHYRIKSSQNVPTGDTDNVLALHFRSCSLFENPTYYSPLPSPAVSGSRGPRMSTDIGSRHANLGSASSSQERTDYIGYDIPKNYNSNGNEVGVEQSEETMAHESANTTMHWMSPSTRKRQYKKIDKANSGLRGFVSKILPRCVSGPPPTRFYEKDKSDTGSVRRYRIEDDHEDDQEDRDQDLEKSVSTVRPRQIVRLVSTVSTVSTASLKKKWGCF